ncbi:MAG: 3'(2'),5'-bisphosphate nucleotidase [Desulfobacterales bacterium]|nr:3'(2'),5'-bisphosphate nucleotidase [Desulfobacterales bacterium]
MQYQKELKVALDAVKKASYLCSKVQKTLVDVRAIEKKDRSPVTIADLGSQGIINLEIVRSFPNEPIVGEEEAGILRDNPDLRMQVVEIVTEEIGDATEPAILEAIDFGNRKPDFKKRFWTVDPIDGTKGFLRGDQYAIALALVENGNVVLGVLGCPNFSADDSLEGQGCVVYAVRGQGAFVRSVDGESEKKISVDSVTEGKEARFCESVEKAHASHEDHERISAALGITAPPFRIDSQAKYAAVASGKASIYLRLPRTREYREKIWDHAAGCIVVTEAGGQVTDFRGKPLDFTIGRKLQDNEGILATNGHLHQKVLKAISDVVQISE